VLTGNVGDNSLTAADLATNSVGTDEVADNAVGQSEIRNNGVAASEIADNSIDGGEIVDGGLGLSDVARRVGTMEWTVNPLGARACEVKYVSIPGAQIAGDFVLISPVTAWPDALLYAVKGTTSETSFKVEACNMTGTTVASGTYLFSYAVIGN
jgi:hypothetical protein